MTNKKITDEIIIEILDFWLDEDYPNNYLRIPEKYKHFGKQLRMHIDSLIKKDYGSGSRTIHSHDYDNLRNELLERIKRKTEINYIKKSQSIIEKQTQLQQKLNEKYDVTNNIMSRQSKIFIFQIIITFLLTGGLIIATILIGNKSNNIAEMQTNISQLQTDILEVSSSPREPLIEIVPDWDDYKIMAHEFVRSNDLNCSNARHCWAEIDMTVYNFGMMDSGHMYCYFHTPNSLFGGYITPNANIRNLEGGNMTRIRLHLYAKECVANNNCDNNSLVPKGPQNVTLECECDGCKSQREFHVIIPFCVPDSKAERKDICLRNNDS